MYFKSGKLTVFQSALYMTNSAIIEDEDVIIMTDPCWLPAEVETINNFLKHKLENKQLYVIYTHSDFDHIIGAGAFPKAKVIASRRFAEHPEKETIIQEIHSFDQMYYISRDYDTIFPAVDIVIDKDDQQLQLGSFTLTFHLAPGHTKDSLFTVIEPEGIFLCGDYLSDVEFPFLSDVEDYFKTLEKAENILKNHNITTLVPGHGHVTQQKEEMHERLESSKYYLEKLRQEDSKLEDYLKAKYPFFEGMKENHKENIKLVKKQ